MEGISVELFDHMGDDTSVVNAARVSFDKQVKEMSEQDERLIKYLVENRHFTPLRHTQVQIRCEAPIFLARQLVKHQAGLSWNEVSRRYVNSEPEFFYPDWRLKPEGSIKQGSGELLKFEDADEVEGHYLDFLDSAEELYNKLMNNYEVAPELARIVLPQSLLTKWMWTGNILAFAHVYNERIAPTAQIEAQDFARKLDKVIRPLYPVSWDMLTKQKEEV